MTDSKAPLENKPAISSRIDEIDEICDRFEEEWRRGGQPNIDDYLLDWQEPSRTELLRELQALAHELEAARTPTSAQAVIEPTTQPTSIGRGKGGTRGLVGAADSPQRLGRFIILERLGRGGFGAVYRARDPQLERDVALKVPRSEVSEDPGLLYRFLRESKTAAQLRHPHIVPVYDAGQEEGTYYIASAFVEGRTLAAEILEHRFDYRGAAELVMQLADALNYAHCVGIIHRDVKPANVMIDRSGEPHLMDFGLARFESSEEHLTLDGSILGTPAYMAPEQASGNLDEVKAACDQYSLGVVLFELLCGKLPFDGSPQTVIVKVLNDAIPRPRTIDASIPKDLETICLKATEKDPAARYANSGELAHDLRRWLDGEPIRARPLSMAERVLHWARREPRIAILSAAVVCTLTTGFVVSTYFWTLARENFEREQIQRQLADTETARALQAESSARSAELAAVQAEHTAVAAQEQEQRQREESQHQLARIQFDRGIGLCEQGDPTSGLVWLARSLETAGDLDPHLAVIIRRNISGWQSNVRSMIWRVEHAGGICCAAFSPDGTLLATGGGEGDVRAWSVETGTAFETVMRHTEGKRVRSVDFSPEGTLLATAAEDGFIRFWHPETGEPAGNPVRMPAEVGAAKFSPDGSLLVAGSWDGSVRKIDVATREFIGEPMRHARGVTSVDFSPGGKMIVAADTSNVARVWNAETGESLGINLRHDHWVSDARYSPDGKQIATASHDGTIGIWDASTGARIAKLPHADWVRHVSFSPDGRQLVSACVRGAATVWNVAELQSKGAPINHADELWVACFSPNGETIFTAGLSGAGQLRHTESGCKPIRVLKGVTAATFDEGKLGVVKGGRQLHWSDPVSGEQLGSDVQLESRISGIEMVVDAKKFLARTDDTTLQLFDKETGKAMGVPMRHEVAVNQGIYRVARSPDRALLVSGGGDRTVRIWNSTTGEPHCAPLMHELRVWSVAFDAHGNRLIAATADTAISTWNVATGGRISEPRQLQETNTWPVYLSRDGRIAAVGSFDYTVHLWDTAAFEAVGLPLHHSAEVEAVAFSDDLTMIATASADRTARVWDSKTGLPLSPPLFHDWPLQFVAVSSDGSIVLTAAPQKPFLLWLLSRPIDGTPAEVMTEMEQLTGMQLSANGLAVPVQRTH